MINRKELPMFKIKRLISIILVLSIFLSSTSTIFASNDNVEKSKIINALRDTEFIKDDMGLSDVNFADFTISEPIYTYEYTPEGINENSFQLYPLKLDDKLTAWAIAFKTGNDISYQISTELVSEVVSVVQNNMQFAIIYDYDNCYLYDGSSLHLLKHSFEHTEKRLVLQSVSDIPSSSNIKLSCMDDSEILGYSTPISTRALTVYKCNVEYVTQHPYDNICWAATVACIVNYKLNKNLSAVDVAQVQYGLSNFDRTLAIGLERDLLSKTYGLPYTYQPHSTSASNILYNIQHDYPIFGTFKQSNTTKNSYHAATIYGINTSNSNIFIMNPTSGSCVGTYDGTQSTYKFISPATGNTFLYWSTDCVFWTLAD